MLRLVCSPQSSDIYKHDLDAFSPPNLRLLWPIHTLVQFPLYHFPIEFIDQCNKYQSRVAWFQKCLRYTFMRLP